MSHTRKSLEIKILSGAQVAARVGINDMTSGRNKCNAVLRLANGGFVEIVEYNKDIHVIHFVIKDKFKDMDYVDLFKACYKEGA